MAEEDKVRIVKRRKKQISVSMPPPLIGFIDDEAEKLCMSRSEYLEHLCMKDFEEKVSRKMLYHFITT